MRSILTPIVVLFIFAQALVAQDWPQWRGPSRDGSVPASGVPANWPASFQTTWRVDIGEGYSSPVTSANRVFVHSRKDPDEIVTAIDLRDGKVTWQQKYAAPFTKNQYATAMAKGPNATPLVLGTRLFTMGATGIFVAWDAASGRQLWQKDYSATVDTSKLFCGTAASPLNNAGAIVIQVGSDVRGGQIVALDPATGAERWTWRGAGPGYASPVIVDVDGTKQIITMTDGSIVGLNPRDGVLLWTVPFPDDWHENIVTPMWTGTDVIVSGPRQGTHAFRLSSAAGKWSAAESWKNTDVTMYMSSPVVGDGLIYGLSTKRRGQFVALDAKTGAVRWATEGRDAEHASILLAPQHVLFLTNSADLVVARRATPAFELVKKYTLAQSQTYAAPVFLDGDMVLRDATGVMRLTTGIR
jgi:outer membrane protein assembly factor BamB